MTSEAAWTSRIVELAESNHELGLRIDRLEAERKSILRDNQALKKQVTQLEGQRIAMRDLLRESHKAHVKDLDLQIDELHAALLARGQELTRVQDELDSRTSDRNYWRDEYDRLLLHGDHPTSEGT